MSLWRTQRNIAFFFFTLAGAALPLYAFPAIHWAGKSFDLATIAAIGFLLAGADSLLHLGAAVRSWLLAAIAVPLLCLIPPWPESFALRGFVFSLAHWTLLVLFFVVAFSLAGDLHRRTLLGINFAVGVIVALYALYQVVGVERLWPGTGATLVSFQREPLRLVRFGQTATSAGFIRPTSVFLEPAWMGGYLSWVLALAPLLLLDHRDHRSARWVRWLLAAGSAILLAAILASVSWGAYADAAACVLVSGVLLLSWSPELRRRLPVALGVGTALILIVGILPPGRALVRNAGNRLQWLVRTPLRAEPLAPTVVRDSSWVRTQNLAHTAALFQRHPIRGVGLGQFANHANESDPAGQSFRDPWCGWVAVAAELGALGPLLLAGAVVLVVARLRRSPSGPVRATAGGLVAFAVVSQIHTGSFADLWWWYPLALAAVLSRASPPEVSAVSWSERPGATGEENS